MINIRKIIKNDKAIKFLIFILSFVVFYSIVFSALAVKKYAYKAGDIPLQNIKAPREIIDEARTNEEIQKAVDNVPLQYNKTNETEGLVVNEINNLIDGIIKYKEQGTKEEKLAELVIKDTNASLSEEDINEIQKLSKEELLDIKDKLNESVINLYENLNIEDKEEEIQKNKDTLILQINNFNLSSQAKSSAVIIVNNVIQPNFFYDEEKTKELQEEAKNDVEPILIKKDQIIVKEGEQITNTQIDLLNQLGLIKGKNNNFDFYFVLGILVLAILYLEFYYLFKFKKSTFEDNKKLALIFVLNGLSLILARSFNIISPFIIPMICVPLLLTLLLDYKISLTISILNSVLVVTVIGYNVEAMIILFLSSVLGSLTIKKLQQRNDIMYSVIFISVILSIITFTEGYLLSNNIIDVIMRTGYVALACMLSGILALGLLPFLESIFGIVTTIKLLELSNPNNSLLRKLSMEAPGTYHHSILVANLSEVAAEQVGANSVLVRTAAYYHDVGKIKRPYFFKENQLGKDNPHDKITPNLSTLIITSHIKDGLELANENKIPKDILDIIEQHHGTTLVKYFYITMKNSSEFPEDIKEEDFRYKGPIPGSKEAGILMLADSIEAAVRSINAPTKGKIEEMVNNIIKDRLNDGQLDNCDLTLKDLNKIRKSFLKVLSGVYHQRIEYPVDKWNKKGEKNDIN
ncbi:MAG: HD family phosphohydrolase [Clostridiaceae bacterium]